MRKDEKGMIVAEALISFTAFILVCIGLVFMIKIFMLHNRVQYAINAAAREMAAYSYIYDALGLRDAEMTVDRDFDEAAGKINAAADDVVDTVVAVQGVLGDAKATQDSISNVTSGNLSSSDIEDVINNAGSLGNSVDEAVEAGSNAIKSVKELDPATLLEGIIGIGMRKAGDAARGVLVANLAELMVEGYLETADADADGYLRAYGVDGYQALDFSSSSMFNDSDFRIVDIVVEYDIDISFLSFVLDDTKIHAVQRASVAAWCGGDNQKVTKQGELYIIKPAR